MQGLGLCFRTTIVIDHRDEASHFENELLYVYRTAQMFVFISDALQLDGLNNARYGTLLNGANICYGIDDNFAGHCRRTNPRVGPVACGHGFLIPFGFASSDWFFLRTRLSHTTVSMCHIS